MASIAELVEAGHVAGVCGNWAAIPRSYPGWPRLFCFIGPMTMTKHDFLTQVKAYIPAERYVMVGNIPGVTGASPDKDAAALAGWEFISEAEFANGSR